MAAGTPPGTPACTPGHCHHRGYIARRNCKRCLQEHFFGYPEQFIPTPLGGYLYAANNMQVGNGAAVRMTLYAYDFVDGSDQLSLRGMDQLAKIASQLPATFFPVVIERTPTNPTLAESRRVAVLTALARGTFPVPPERVVVAAPTAIPLRGVEGELITINQLARTAAGGPPVGTSYGPGGFSGATQTISTLGGGR
jgi:hypothetical protein